MKKRVLITVLFVLSSNLLADSNKAEEIFDAKCSMCHLKERPLDKSKVVAPALMGVMRHLKQTYSNKSKAVAFIKDYVINPDRSKSICMPQKIKRFGLMPSQKGNISEEELDMVASWMFDNFPNKRGAFSCKGKMDHK